VPKFDYETISDVIMYIQYSVLNGDFILRSVASKAARKTAEGNAIHGRDEGFWAI
jgi:hypothetical protein